MANTLTHRELHDRDAAAVTEILAAMQRAEPVDEAYSEQDVLEEMTAPGVDLERTSIGIVDDDRLVAFGWLRVSPPSPAWKAQQLAGVHPDYVGRGIGRMLLRGLESKAAAVRDMDAPGLPGELKIWLDPERQRTVALVAAAGYETWRYFFRMRRDLHTPIQEWPAPAGSLIRRYRPSDDEAVRLASNSSFADHWGSTPMDRERWRADYADSSSFRPEQSWVALLGDEVVAFVMTSEFEEENRQRGYPTGYIARVGTTRDARGRGIAGALLARTLGGLADAGYRYAELGVDADSPTGAGRLYERAGFVTIGRNPVAGKRF